MAKDRISFLFSLAALGILAAYLFGHAHINEIDVKAAPATEQVKEQIKDNVVQVLVAQQKINTGSRLVPATYTWQEIDKKDADPTLIIKNPNIEEHLKDAVTVREIPQGARIKRLDILWPEESKNNQTENFHVRPGRMVVMIELGEYTAPLNNIKPGMKIDLIFTSKTDFGFGTVYLPLFNNIPVLSIKKDGTDNLNSPKSGQTTEVFLEMTPRDAEAFSFAQQAGILTLRIAQRDDGAKQEYTPEEMKLKDQLLGSRSLTNFNSILITHMIHTLFPNADVKITTIPKGYIAAGNVHDPAIAEKIKELLLKSTPSGDREFIDLMETDDNSVPLEEGKLSVLLQLTENSAITQFMTPGMYVNIIFSSKSDLAFGNITLTLLRNIRVLSIGNPDKPSQPFASSNRGPVDVLLQMSPREAEIFSFSQHVGVLSIGLIQKDNESEETPDEERLRNLLLTSKSNGNFNSILATYMIRTLFPDVDVSVIASSKGYIVSGRVEDPQVAMKIKEILEKLCAGGEKDLINLMDVVPQQIMICVRVLEVDKDIKTSLGVNWQALYEHCGTSVALASVFPRPGLGAPDYFLNAMGIQCGDFTLSGVVDMLKTVADAKVMAEPNLTTISGQTAHFFAGGEFPILIPQGGANLGTVTVEYKQYGVILDFTPIVDLNGLISMHVVPEVSTINPNNPVEYEGFNIPSLLTRKVDTTVKLWPGQCYAIAGLLQYDRTQQITSLYCLDRLPIIGPLFRSKQFEDSISELMFVIAAYLIHSEPPPPDSAGCWIAEDYCE